MDERGAGLLKQALVALDEAHDLERMMRRDRASQEIARAQARRLREKSRLLSALAHAPDDRERQNISLAYQFQNNPNVPMALQRSARADLARNPTWRLY